MAQESQNKTITPWLSLARPWHWVKNLLIVLPMVFNGSLLDPDCLIWTAMGFFAFNFVSSAVYIFNDASDVEADRRHPTKKERPLASGAVPMKGAIALMVVLVVLAFAIDCAIPPMFSLHTLIIASYLAMNVAYSRFLKRFPIIDVAVLSLGFLLRVLYGGAVCGITVSSWLYLTVLSLAFFFSLGKRRNEIRTAGTASRSSLETGGYTVAFLDKCMYVFLACGIVFYALWATTGIERELGDVGNAFLLATVFIAMVTCMLYCFDIEQENSEGDPVSTVLADKSLLLAVFAWCVCIVVALYL